MGEEERRCPRCGGKMSLVAAGWYCMKDDFLIDRVTGESVVGGPEFLIGPSVEERVERPKRPLGLTVIAVLWLLGGIYNLFMSSQTIGSDLQVLPLLSRPTVPEWFKFGVPVELAINLVGFALGLVQLFTIYGLWTGKSWSYRLALAVPLLAVVLLASQVGLYESAPVELDLLKAALWVSLVTGIAFAVVYWNYLRQGHVKKYLGVRRIEERGPPPV